MKNCQSVHHHDLSGIRIFTTTDVVIWSFGHLVKKEFEPHFRLTM